MFTCPGASDRKQSYETCFSDFYQMTSLTAQWFAGASAPSAAVTDAAAVASAAAESSAAAEACTVAVPLK